jgi:hypothetical protein
MKTPTPITIALEVLGMGYREEFILLRSSCQISKSFFVALSIILAKKK